MTLKPWREIAEPHADVRAGKFQQAGFAADLSRVHVGTANADCRDLPKSLARRRSFLRAGCKGRPGPGT